ncbi:hypothetical protein BSK62_13255 [Paenibacillus odorifer]|uniref:hypothetical protein n=1 Tax=Paenibacillus odorifer TaxID=189426 RepID=UPI00096D8A23|nr:hypothetical protein [Paenibacillus odorifer]OMD66029.1 hypothetical protein BSK62_13255 [Paenibacillus odorifer]
MSKSVIFGVSKETVGTAMDQIKKVNEDSMMVLAPFVGNMSTHAPAKKGKNKGYYRIKCEIWIPEDAIEGENALTDFGAFAVMRLPKDRIKDHMKS